MMATAKQSEADDLEIDIRELNSKYENNEIVKEGGKTGCRLNRTNQIVSDPEFDQMVKRLESLRPDSEVLTEITGAIGEDAVNVPKVMHNPPMASISKAIGKLDKKKAELKKWLSDRLNDLSSHGQIIQLRSNLHSHGHPFEHESLEDLAQAKYGKSQDPIFVISLKRDGVACRVYYENGILAHAGLRPRNGVIAPDIIEHVKNVSGIPQTLPVPITCAIGGELEILISDFNKALNDEVKLELHESMPQYARC